ncbi:MAG: hypothetical protein ACI9NT_001420 [Bacteroidia bacterium]|jgi:hypothetical protein
MPESLSKLLSWGPVFFGVFLFAPMWAAVLDAAAITLPFGVSSLHAAMALGLLLGLLAKFRGSWL